MGSKDSSKTSVKTFIPAHRDYDLSPYTGLNRESWLDACEYLLTGVFNNIKSMDDPVVMPRTETKITYPHGENDLCGIKAEYFEGLARSFFLAAPLIRERKNLTINGINIKDYYRAHILHTVDPKDPLFVGSIESLRALRNDYNPFGCFQQTVESCALVICLWETEQEIWESYSQAEKDLIAAFIRDYGEGPTVPQNWRLFNMLDLAFLHSKGYRIDRQIMREHAAAISNYYAGDGWYRDGHSFDYYSVWAFNVYTAIWNVHYGYENEPELAAVFERNSNKLMETYPAFFDEDGYTTMWGRSGVYRFASTSAFGANQMLRRHADHPGYMRRIASGALLQFLERPDFLNEYGIPTMGYYSQFGPLVQGYSCAESPFWMGKAFLCLDLPADHPFWTDKEENGKWEKDSKCLTSIVNGPGIAATNFHANGETVLRSGKIVKNRNDIHGMMNYSKLTFNSKFPWEAVAESQMYVHKDLRDGEVSYPNVTYWGGEKDGVLYRRQYFGYHMETECHWLQGMSLADFPVEKGIMRADRSRFFKKPVELMLGAYGFPDNGTEIERLEEEFGGKTARAIVLRGKDALGHPRAMAFTTYTGFTDIELKYSDGTNPDSVKSIIPVAHYKATDYLRYNEPEMLISQVITDSKGNDFSRDDIFPIERIEYEDREGNGGMGIVTIVLKNGDSRTIDFDEMEGRLMV